MHICDPSSYRLVRVYANPLIKRHTIRKNVSFEEAQRHCKMPNSSSVTCNTHALIRKTKKMGHWYDTYFPNPPKGVKD